MAKPICRVISNAFYDGKLRVCTKAARDPKWNRDREPMAIRNYGRQHACLIRTEYESNRSPRYGGVIRYETAQLIRDLVDELTAVVRREDILVLTPYRAQRHLIKTFLKNSNHKKVTVSTVHRAQGSEREIVIFDPVEAANSFLNNRDLGPRLINVALSRAKAQLFVIASEENLRNPILRQIANLIEGHEGPTGVASLCSFVFRTDFPGCALGKEVQVLNSTGKVVCTGRVVSYDSIKRGIVIADFASGRERKFLEDNVKEACQHRESLLAETRPKSDKNASQVAVKLSRREHKRVLWRKWADEHFKLTGVRLDMPEKLKKQSAEDRHAAYVARAIRRGEAISETAQSLIEYCRKDRRVCPLPPLWNRLWEMLPNRRCTENGAWEPPLPLILGGWQSPENLKRLRLTEHIKWAEQHGALALVATFLRNLQEKDWHHLGD